jgi:hypothetical protein
MNRSIAIQNLQSLTVPDISFNEDNHLFKIKYKLYKGVYMIGLSIKINSVSITQDKYNYLLNIHSKSDYEKIYSIDEYFNQNITNYKSYLRDKKIIFYKNQFLDTFYEINKNKITSLYLNIKYIKKGKDNYPIIHIINES